MIFLVVFAVTNKRCTSKVDDDNAKTKSFVFSISAQLKQMQLQVQVRNVK